MNERALAGVESLRRLGLRLPLPKRVARVLGAAYHGLRRRVMAPRIVAQTSFRGVVNLRSDGHRARIAGLRGPTTIGTKTTVRFTEERHLEFLRHVYDYPGNGQCFEPPFVAHVARGMIHIPTGAVATADRALVTESCRGKIEWALEAAPLPLQPVRLSGPATTILASVSGNYYHWLIDCLPRLFVLAQAQLTSPPVILVPDALKPFQRLTLESCLPDGFEVRYSGAAWVQPDEVVFPSLVVEPATGYLPRACVDYLRTRIFERVGTADDRSPKHRRRLYIPRSIHGQPRRIVNETALIERLARQGFEVCRPERLSFEEQVRTFRSAEAVVGPRGAALTNMLFATDLKVLELTAPIPFAGPVYFSLAYALGHEYHHLFTTPVDEHFSVDLDHLDRALERMALAA